MFRFDQLIRRDMIIRDVKQSHPETVPVFEDFGFRSSCDECDIETVARKNGIVQPRRGGRPQPGRLRPQRRPIISKKRTDYARIETRPQSDQRRYAATRRFFLAEDRRGHRRHRNRQHCGAHHSLEPGEQPLRRHRIPHQSEAAQRVGREGLQAHFGGPARRWIWRWS